MRAELIEDRIIVWNIVDAQKLFENGYFGKPIGIPKPKPGEIDAPLVLDLFEALYLQEKSTITIYDGSRKVSMNSLLDSCRHSHTGFDKKYTVYKDFRDKGYIVTTGIKFGCDFAVYKKGPGIDHAPYLVQVYSRNDQITATGTVLAGRLATTVRKQFILAIPDKRNGVSLITLNWWKA